MYVVVHLKKNLQIWYKFYNTQLYNLFVKKNFKVFLGLDPFDKNMHVFQYKKE